MPSGTVVVVVGGGLVLEVLLVLVVDVLLVLVLDVLLVLEEVVVGLLTRHSTARFAISRPGKAVE